MAWQLQRPCLKKTKEKNSPADKLKTWCKGWRTGTKYICFLTSVNLMHSTKSDVYGNVCK